MGTVDDAEDEGVRMKPEERAALIRRMADPGGTHEREAIKAKLEAQALTEECQAATG